MKLTRPALGLALVGLVASVSFASAADAPKTTATSKTMYLSQEGCGTTAQPGRLEPKAAADSATGCGTIGGLPIDELIYQLDGGPAYEEFTSTSKVAPFIVDGTKKVTGQIAAGAWSVPRGVGTVDVDVHLVGRTAAGTNIDFGETQASAPASDGTITYVPFTLNVPAAANGQTFKTFVLGVHVHGANLGVSAKQLDGDSYVVIPAKVPPKKRGK